MLCIRPHIGPHGVTYGCGKCTPCKVNKRREWTGRLVAEASQHENVAFASFTYDPEHVPEGNSLRRRDMTLFWERLHRHMGEKVRNFTVGEYGDETQRPHYHAIMFNFLACYRGETLKNKPSCCPQCDTLRNVWGKGFVMLKPYEDVHAQYCAGYVVKKMTRPDDNRLEGREPEFAQPPRKPPLGAHLVEELASVHLEHNLEQLPDIIPEFQIGKKKYPLGRTLTQRLRLRVGHSPETPDEVKQQRIAEAKPLWDEARKDATPGNKEFAYKSALMDAAEGKRIQIEAKLRRTKRHL